MKSGDWNGVSLMLEHLHLRAKKLQEYILTESANAFQNGIKSEIIRNDVKPDNKSFSSQDYSDNIIIRQQGDEVFIGLPGEAMVHEVKISEFAIPAEFGLKGTKFMGMWRRFTDRFVPEFKKRIEQINAGGK